MKPQKVAEMDVSQCNAAQHTHTHPTPSQQQLMGPVCVGAASPCSAPPRRPAGAHCSTKLPRNAVNSHRCGRRLQTAPLQASSVTFDSFLPIRRLTAASAIPGFGFWFLLLHMWSLTPIHPGPLCTSTQRQTTKHRWSHRTHNSGQRPG